MHWPVQSGPVAGRVSPLTPALSPKENREILKG